MAIKEIPTNFRVYYKSMKDTIKPKYKKAVDDYEQGLVDIKALCEDIKLRISFYKETYNIDLLSYKEFNSNSYINGEFYDAAKSLFLNKKKNYLATNPAYTLYKLARKQKELHELKHQIDVWEKMLDLTLDEYNKVLQSFYNEVHKRLIIDGYGYVLESPIGWICINRCKVVQGARKKLNFQETKKNKEKLLAEGKRLWNKEEAEYARSIGADYNGVDYRVYLDSEVCYEIPLIGCRLNTGEKYRLTPTFARRHIKGKTNEQLIAECDNDLNKICELPIDLKLKLNLCLQADNILYLNFIRNEAQQSAHTPKANRKNRQ